MYSYKFLSVYERIVEKYLMNIAQRTKFFTIPFHRIPNFIIWKRFRRFDTFHFVSDNSRNIVVSIIYVLFWWRLTSAFANLSSLKSEVLHFCLCTVFMFISSRHIMHIPNRFDVIHQPFLHWRHPIPHTSFWNRVSGTNSELSVNYCEIYQSHFENQLQNWKNICTWSEFSCSYTLKAFFK